ncbi:MAG: hypothetical protein ACLP7F_19335, partial [Acidimicrobiales bacterium]
MKLYDVRPRPPPRAEEAYRQASKISPAGALAPSAPYALLVHLDLVEAAVRTGRQEEAAAHVVACQRAGSPGCPPGRCWLGQQKRY